MHTKKSAWLVMVVLTVLVKIFSFFPYAVERYYSTGLYPVISRVLRGLFGWVPFSLGDVLYLATGVFLLVKIVRLFAAVFKKKAGKAFWWNGIRWLAFYSLMVYVVFNIFWGLNYNRLGMAYQMRLQLTPYSTAELQQVVTALLQKLEATHQAALAERKMYANRQALFDESYHCYQLAATQYPHIRYATRSVKPSLYKTLGDYLGYMGYYNPFTGEAQVNTTVPVFVRPFVTCHEMGHQLGYAKENEANFAGYLSARSSATAAFKYAVYFDLYSYAIRELYGRDSILAIALNKQKPLQVATDIVELRNFFDAYENPVEPYIRKLYGQYLKANEQPSGMQSYNEVMAFLIAYYKKYGAEQL